MKTHDEDMNKDWLDDIRHRMSRYETDAPPGLWEEIEKSMAMTEKQPRVSRPRGFVLWTIRFVDVAAVIVAVLTVALFFVRKGEYFHDENTCPASLALVGEDNHDPLCEKSDVADAVITVSVSEYVAREAYAGTVAMADFSEQTPSEDIRLGLMDKVIADTVSVTGPFSDRPAQTADSLDKHETEQIVRRFIDTDNKSFGKSTAKPDPSFSASGEKAGAFRMSVFTSSGTGARMNRHSPGEILAVNGMHYAAPLWKDDNSLGLSLLNKGLDTDTEYKHRLPVRAGLTVGWQLNLRWALETGLTYANLTSDVREGSYRNYYKGEQRLHYLGIPVNARYSIYRWKRLDFYASAGVLAEKCVSAKLSKDYYLNGNSNGRENKKLHSHPVQMSVNAGLGIDFNIVGAVSVYAEPGAAYYFDDRSSLNTIYKEKPFNFNFDFGLRLTLGR